MEDDVLSWAKRLVRSFNMCETHGDATVGKALMFAFADLKQ
jgi:hypothetical protein